MKQRLSALVFPLLFFLGFGMLLYPTVSDRWNRHTQSRAIVDYAASVEGMTYADFSRELAAAREYNKSLREIRFPLMYADRIGGYEQCLSVEGSDIMGYVSVEKIGVELPIYHGTSDAVLNVGVGHLQGTSLPVGGLDTHAVLSAHRGLPSAKLFTDLDRMLAGDTFALHILGQTLTYRVEDVLVVLPEEVDALYVQTGRDLCTLMTCTPYGINTHRLLVRGSRIETPIVDAEPQAPADAASAEAIAAPLVGVVLTVPVLMIAGCIALMVGRIRSKGGENHVLSHMA